MKDQTKRVWGGVDGGGEKFDSKVKSVGSNPAATL
jgi:hypothetical protein